MAEPLKGARHELSADLPVIMVLAGAADVFAVRPSGSWLPLGAIDEGGFAFRAAPPARIIVVAEPGAILAEAEPASEVADDEFARFARAVGKALPLLASTSGAHDARLADAINDAIATEIAQRHARAAATQAADQHSFDASVRSLASAASTLAMPEPSVHLPPLAATIAHLGTLQGFSVTAPTHDEMVRAASPVQAISARSGVRYRNVRLQAGWQKELSSPLLVQVVHEDSADVEWLAIRPRGRRIFCRAAGDPAWRPLARQDVQDIQTQAFEFYSPLPADRAVGFIDIARMAFRSAQAHWVVAILGALAVSVLGLLTPLLTDFVVSSVIPQGDAAPLIEVGMLLGLVAVVAFVLTLIQALAVAAIGQHASRTVQGAMWARLLALPVSFFQDFTSGELAVRVLAIDSLQGLISPQIATSALAAIFGLINLVVMFVIDPMLAAVGAAFLVVTVVLLFVASRKIAAMATISLRATRSANSWMVQLLRGVTKIRMAHAENRLEARYLTITAEQTVAAQQTRITGWISAWTIFAVVAAPASFYLIIAAQWGGSLDRISAGKYMALSTAFGMAFAGIAGLTWLLFPIANAGPTLEMVRPLMDALPESVDGVRDPGPLRGAIELRDVRYRYTDDGPLVLKAMSITIEPGEFVAIVGPSGAGKSTLSRLLLGFASPTSGEVLFDGMDLRDLDHRALRAQLGVVIQGGSLMQGSVAENILGAMDEDLDRAWEAADAVGLGDDIRAMPMQMHTRVDPQTVSGGQAQRILLARAIVRRPAVLILDEATNALDNASQAQVTRALEGLRATRIVIAHRLSTIRHADRILVLADGELQASGTFDELARVPGLFAQMVAAQQLTADA